jgi:hypothetical protein
MPMAFSNTQQSEGFDSRPGQIYPKQIRFILGNAGKGPLMYFQFSSERGTLSEILLFFDEKFQELKSLSLMLREMF